MFKNAKNTKQQGNIGISSAILYYTKLGYCVSLPLNDSQDYDLVVDKDNTLFKVQVKTTSCVKPSGSFAVELRNKGGTSGIQYSTTSDGSSGILFILCMDGSMYEIPKEVYKDIKSSITLGTQYQKYRVS